MAPPKVHRPILSSLGNRITTRSKTATNQSQNVKRNKRKAEGSPPKENDVKRSAFYDVTNAKLNQSDKRTASKRTSTKPAILKEKQNENLAPPPAPIVDKIQTRASLRYNNVTNETAVKSKDTQRETNAIKKKTRLSNEFEKTGESLYSTALEEM